MLTALLFALLGLLAQRAAPSVAHAQPLQLRPLLERLSPLEQQRFIELSDRRTRRLAFPIVLTTLSSVAFLGVFAAYAALRDTTCYDYQSDDYHDCSMRESSLAFAVVPAAGVALGAWLIDRAVANRREYEGLIWKASLRPLVARGSLGVASSLSF